MSIHFKDLGLQEDPGFGYCDSDGFIPEDGDKIPEWWLLSRGLDKDGETTKEKWTEHICYCQLFIERCKKELKK